MVIISDFHFLEIRPEMGERMSRVKFNVKYEHREFLNDLKNVVISYTPLSGLFDTAKFLNKWILKKRKVHKLGRHMNRRFRMFTLERTAKRYNSP
jgi:hypothetical protein